MHLSDSSSSSMTERDISVEEQQETIERVSVSTQTDQYQKEMTVTAKQYSNKGTMTDDIQFTQVMISLMANQLRNSDIHLKMLHV